MVELIYHNERPEVLVVTPLLPGHKVSKETKVTLKRNKTRFNWFVSMGNSNIPTNALRGIEKYKKMFQKLPEFYIMIDRDIVLGRGMLDKLVKKLRTMPEDKVGYAYASFKFEGHINQEFPAIPFDINALVQSNYISSNSLFRSKAIEEVGLVTDDKYKRLLDWAFLLKCYAHGYVGVPEPKASFVAKSTKDDISAGSQDDYKLKHYRVHEDFVKPLIKKLDN